MSLAGRPRQPNAKKHLVSVRLTAQEKEEFTTRFGSPGKGIRVAIDKFTRSADAEEPPKKMKLNVQASNDKGKGPKTTIEVEPRPSLRQHRHRRGAAARHEFEAGQKVTIYTCAEADCDKELR